MFIPVDVWIRTAQASKYARMLVASCFVLVLAACGLKPSNRIASTSVVKFFISEALIPVSMSPDGRYVLLKSQEADSFVVSVIDARSRRNIARLSSLDTQLSLTWRPDSKEIVFVSDRGGNENYHLHRWAFLTNTLRTVALPLIDTAAPPLRWSPCGGLLVVEAKMKGVEHLLVVTMNGHDAGSWRDIGEVREDTDFQVSPDGSTVAFVSNAYPDSIRTISVEGSPLRSESAVVCPGGEVKGLGWMSDGDRIVCTSRAITDDFFTLSCLDRRTGKVRSVVRAVHDAQRPKAVPGTNKLLFELNVDGLNRVCLVDLKSDSYAAISPVGRDTRVQSISLDGSRAFCAQGFTTRQPTLTELDLESVEQETKLQLGLAVRSGVSFCERSLAGSGGRLIHISVWLPSGAAPQLKGAVVFVHGGMHLQNRPTWDSKIAFLLKNNLAFMAVNYRGSDGYGKRYERDDSVEGQAQDVAAVLSFASRSLHVSDGRVVLVGESYGCQIACEALSVPGFVVRNLVLISPTGLDLTSCPETRVPKQVLVFQGDNDSPYLRSNLVKSVSQCFGDRFLDYPGHVVVRVGGEGHRFRHATSWATVFQNLLLCFEN